VEGNIQVKTADGTTAIIHDGDDGLYFVGITSSTPFNPSSGRVTMISD
jgi:hypothetical protein